MSEKILSEGVYEQLISQDVQECIVATENEGKTIQTEAIDQAESAAMLSEYIAKVVRQRLEDIKDEKRDVCLEKRIEMANKILETVSEDESTRLTPNDTYLSEVISQQENSRRTAGKQKPTLPDSGFRTSNLFAGKFSQLPLVEEIRRDILSADSIDIIVSFLRMSGINMILPALKEFCEQEGHSLRIITTTYCSVTEGKAVKQLSELPNTEIRISYNTQIERLHAKAYIFKRNSGYTTAYIGSSNLSKSALTDGLEWNIRVTNVENEHIIRSAQAAFDNYWENEDFVDFAKDGLERFNRELQIQRTINSGNEEVREKYLQHFTLYSYQKAILDRLQVERTVHHNYRNLVVAATGTGKTVMSAFDYKYFCQQNTGQKNRLLFVVHREEILKQARVTYRSVLNDANFGELWVGNYRPTQFDYIFISVQTANSQIETLKGLGVNYFDYIVIDEAHHGMAQTYQQIFDFFQPKILLGLTGTPERMDGQDLLQLFNHKVSAEIRLPQALHAGLLTPFQYYCITDSADLSSEDLWVNGGYEKEKLTDKLNTPDRVNVIVKALRQYLPDEYAVKALCFCSTKRQAEYMATNFKELGFKAEHLTGNSDKTHRNRVNEQLRTGEINYLFVVDLFNEGVDIPEVDTVLFLRPTESLTIFLQQLGRGLRLAVGKMYLTVLDFVAQANQQYDFASRFRALTVTPTANIGEQIKNGFTLLPHGCSIQMEKVAQERILQNINEAIYNKNRLTRELRQMVGTPKLAEFVNSIGQDLRIIYQNNRCWTLLKKWAGKIDFEEDEFTKRYVKGMGNIIHTNSPRYLQFIRTYLDNKCKVNISTKTDEHFALMLYYSLYQDKLSKTGFNSLREALEHFAHYPYFVQELREIVEYITANIEFNTIPTAYTYLPESLDIYGCYTREEIFILFGKQTTEVKMQGQVAGVTAVADDIELFFVTLNKSDKDFSPTTLYEDYIMSERKFHWQSQNNDSHFNKGKRFVEQPITDKKFILFVRDRKEDEFGNTCPFYCFGPVKYLSSTGDNPMNIVWQTEKPILPQFLRAL